jgi:hypothetical protein
MMKNMLDDMAVHFDGPGSEYDPDHFDKMQSCMLKWEDDDFLLNS